MEIHEVKILFFWHQVDWIFQLGKDPIVFVVFLFVRLFPFWAFVQREWEHSERFGLNPGSFIIFMD